MENLFVCGDIENFPLLCIEKHNKQMRMKEKIYLLGNLLQINFHLHLNNSLKLNWNFFFCGKIQEGNFGFLKIFIFFFQFIDSGFIFQNKDENPRTGRFQFLAL